ncbi:MAG: cytochrome-c peroxidase [Bacteroidia bacterium]|nr:MAG: cytochrome-c peroxidase [Bacteroidia bacterium]
MIKLLLHTAIFLFLLYGCKVDPEIKPALPADDIRVVVPPGWPSPHYNFENNPLTKEGFVLGRSLFYEPMLSRDNTISCGSCHQQFAAFAHAGHNLSHGIDGKLGNRNALPLFNLTWHPYFMWDGGVNHIEIQPLAPIINPVEMDEDINNVVQKLQQSEKYKKMFKDAFGDETINSQRIFKALAQFMGTMYSYRSKYDMYKQGKVQFNLSEQRGYQLFVQKCAACHKEPLFTDFSFRNNGLAVNTALQDSGRMRITGNPNDRNKFKVPSLRNVALSSPYMHDGRFETLQQVLEHYSSGIVQSPTLDSLLINGIPLSPQDKQDIINFLYTLTDYEFVYDKKYADPNH